MELYPTVSLCYFWLVLYQASMADTVPVAQWIALQTEVSTLQRENRELQAENRVLQGKLNDLMNEKVIWVEEKSALRGERITLQNKYDNLKKEHDELVEEHHDYMEETREIFNRQRQQLPETEKCANALRAEMERQDTMTKQKARNGDQRKVLLDKFYDCSTGQFDLTTLFKYCKAYRVPPDVIKEALTADHRETLNLPKRWKSSVGDANVGEFFETIVAALPNLKSITGPFTSIEDCYIQYKRGEVPREVLEIYCAGSGKTTYQLTKNTSSTLQSAGLSVSEYLATVIPLLPEVMSVSVYESNITTLDWCAGLSDRITRIDISGCPNIKDCTPLLKMKGLKKVYRDDTSDLSIQEVKGQLKKHGVAV
ncbi:hypothetical protein AGDE_17146 [Angomonas deanei]|nr:hypothetical protein AGDE_17146 [Angomonas deanei]|eukprot:EPY15365.1 hypothetical protein AGDE_17146 [Angomonas deanei]